MEQATEKSPNFQQILLNTRRSFSQNFNDVASFVLELLGFIFYVYTIFYALLRNFIKTKQAIEKAPHFEEVITNTWTVHNQNLHALATLVLELLG